MRIKKVDMTEKLAALRGTDARSRRRPERAVNEYQKRLGLTYEEWVELASEQLMDVPEDQKEETILALILLLRQMLQADGRRYITEGMHLGLGSTLPTPDLDRRLQNKLLENDNFMGNSLIPAIDERIRKSLEDPNIVTAGAFATAMMALQARTELYAGAMWTMMQDAVGEVSKKKDDPRVRWVLDDLAKHCPDCPRFAGIYDSFDTMLAATNGAMPGAGVQCNGNCFLPGMMVMGEFEACLESNYSGPVREMLTRSGNRLAVTANHPILTADGWLPTNRLYKGQYLVSYRGTMPAISMINKHNEDKPTPVQEIFKTLSRGRPFISAGSRGTNFHGDAQWTDGNVNIVAADWKLLGYIQSMMPEIGGKFIFEPTAFEKPLIGCASTSEFCRNRISLSSTSLPCATCLTLDQNSTLLDGSPFQELGLRPASHLYTMLYEAAPERISGNPLAVAQLLQRYASQIFLDEIIEIVNFHHSGHVYDLQTETGTMIAQNIVASNCRCRLEYISNGEWTGP